MTQLTLDQALQARDAALERLAARDQTWSGRAYAAVLMLAMERPDFISDDVWAYIEKPANPKALGAVLMRLARERRIVATGELRPHPQRHATKTMVWRLVAR